MKRFFALLLAALMALGGAACAAAGDMVLGRDEDGGADYFRYVFSEGDMLYLVGYGGVYTYRLGDEDLRQYQYPPVEDADQQGLDVQTLPFLSDGDLYAIQLFSKYDEHAEFIRAALVSLTLGEDDTIAVEERMALDWEDMVDYYDQSSYASAPETMLAIGGKLLMRVYDSQGDYVLKLLDVDTGRIESLDDPRGIVSIVPYRDGTALLQQFTYEQTGVVRFFAFDPADESTRLLGEFEAENYSAVSGLAYDAETDSAYCLKGGEVCPLDLATGETGEGIADMPLEAYSGSNCACVLEGGIYVFASEGVALRSLNAETPASGKLKIFDGSWSDSVTNAVYRFSNAHSDVRTVVSRDYGDGENIIEAMMNRESNIDIYVLDCASNEYDAVYNRGYMMELDGAQGVVAFADAAYPALREALSHDGHVVAVPVSVLSFTMGVNEKALERLGMQLSDVPSNWMDFLDFLNTLPEKFAEVEGVSLFYPDFTVEEVRNQLFYALFEDYQHYVNATDPAIGYNTELLRGLLKKLEAVDFEAMGYAHEEEGDDTGAHGGMVVMEYGTEAERENYELFQTGVGCTFGNFWGGDAWPMLMSMDEQTPTVFALDTSVAFVNPFTQNPEAALAFMDELSNCLSAGVRYSFDPTLDEPIRDEYYEENLREAEAEKQNITQQLEDADPEEKQALEDMLRSIDETLAYHEEYGWEISQKQIDWYRANDEYLTAAKVNWLYADGSGEAWELISQYQAGQISGDEMLASIDKKVQMMLLEGN